MRTTMSTAWTILLLSATVIFSEQQWTVAAYEGSVITKNQESIEVMNLFKGDSENGPGQLPLQKLAQITLSDLKAAWKEAGIEPYAWEESPSTRSQTSAYPALYEIQSYVAFEYECHYSEVSLLLNDAQAAEKVVHSEAAKRALSVLIAIASRQSSLKQGISFRSHVLYWPPRTEIVP